MKKIEENVMHSFRLCKNDIIKVKNEIVSLSEAQERIMEMLDGLKTYQEKLYGHIKIISKKDVKPKTIIKTIRSKPKTIIKTIRSKPKTIVKTITKYAKKRFVASKEGKGYHIPHCPFAQNIKPKSKLTFKSKAAAVNKGYKACKCVK